MTSSALRFVTVATLLGAGALAGCRDDAPAPAPAAPPVASAPVEAPEPEAPAPAVVTAVELGNEVTTDNRVATPASAFATGDTIYASVATDGGSAAKIGARWTFGEDRLVHETEADVPAGPQVIAFDIQHPEGWPVGAYRIEVLLDGTVVETREFAVR
ncbi:MULTISPECIES: hypothetical protein [Luteimonas]|uniref:hypothetical protein n=1 Tax=Luteimonas TaxID=83614 RepID=UPI0018ED4419|nr:MULTISPECIES: hypothetical protein [Luteimonas]